MALTVVQVVGSGRRGARGRLVGSGGVGASAGRAVVVVIIAEEVTEIRHTDAVDVVQRRLFLRIRICNIKSFVIPTSLHPYHRLIWTFCPGHWDHRSCQWPYVENLFRNCGCNIKSPYHPGRATASSWTLMPIRMSFVVKRLHQLFLAIVPETSNLYHTITTKFPTDKQFGCWNTPALRVSSRLSFV